MKKPKQLLFAVIVICFFSTLFAKNTLNQMIAGSEKVWEREYEGELKDIFIDEDSEDVVILTENLNNYQLYYFNDNGEQIWKITSSEKIWTYLHGLNVSKNGETIVVHTVNYNIETQQSWIYTKEGHLIFSYISTSDGWFYPSPSGKYLTLQPTNNFTPFVIYNRDGSQLLLNVPPELQTKRQMHRFVSENEVLVYKETINEKLRKAEFILVKIPDMYIKWVHQLKRNLWLIDFNERNCAVNDKYIAIQGTAMSGDIMIFNKESGNLIWEINEPQSNYGLSFINEGKQLIALTDRADLYLVDTEKGNVLDKKRLFERGLISAVPKFSYADGQLVLFSNDIEAIDENVFETQKKVTGMYSVIFSMDNNKKIINKSFIKSVIRLYDSKKDQKAYLVGQINKDKNLLLKNHLERGK